MLIEESLKSGIAPTPIRKPWPLAADCCSQATMPALSARASIAASSSFSGSMPWALIFASSMPVAQKSPTSLSTPEALSRPAACSASWRWIAVERSWSISNAPQLVRSPGTGLAARNFALAQPAKSTQASRLSSRSASWKRFTGGRPVWSRTKAGSVAAGALAVAWGASVPPQAETAAAMARDSSNRRGAVARMWISGVDGYGDGGSAGTGLGRTVRRRPVSRGCRRSCAGPVGPCDAAPVQAESVVWHGIGGAGMRVHFHGAAGEVTGSMHLVEAAGRRILLDCGMIQGGREAEARNFAPFPFDPASIDALVLSHAHIDHIGRVPRLVWQGFRGPVFIQRAGADLLPVMLLDAASLAEN